MAKKPTEVFPIEIWLAIIQKLDLISVVRMRRVCTEFFNNNAIKNEVTNTWFHELAAQFHGEGALEARAILDHCRDHLDNSTTLLQLADQLLHQPPPNADLLIEENDVQLNIAKLTRINYRNSRDNPRDLLIRSVKFLTTHSNNLIATPKRFIEQEKNYDRWFRRAAFGGIGLMVLGLINQFITSPSSYRYLLSPVCMLSGAALAISSQLKKDGFFQRNQNPGFWKKYDDAPENIQIQLTHLQRLMAQQDNERSTWKFAGAATVVILIITLALAYVLVRTLSHHAETQPSTTPSLR